jgi:tetratricopeptide (TPR) repeat protein
MTLHVFGSQVDAGSKQEAIEIDRQVAAFLWSCEEEAYFYADELIERALALVGPTDPLRLTLMKRRGKLYREQGRLGEALLVLERAVALAETTLGATDNVTRRLRSKLCKVLERMSWRSGLSPDEQQAHQRWVEDHFSAARRRALESGQPGVAAVLLGDLATYWAQLWHCSHYTVAPRRFERAQALYQQARDELTRMRDQLGSSGLDDELAVICDSLGGLFAMNCQWGDALIELRRAAKLLSPQHPLYKSVLASLRHCSDELRAEEDARYYRDNPDERDW